MDINLYRVGSMKKQVVSGVPKIKYGWVDNKNRKVFYSVLGGHIKLKNNDSRIINILTSRLKNNINTLAKAMLPHTKYSIINIDIPSNITTTLRGYVGIEVMIHSKVIIDNKTIELFNSKIVDLLLSYNEIEVYPTKKY